MFVCLISSFEKFFDTFGKIKESPPNLSAQSQKFFEGYPPQNHVLSFLNRVFFFDKKPRFFPNLTFFSNFGQKNVLNFLNREKKRD